MLYKSTSVQSVSQSVIGRSLSLRIHNHNNEPEKLNASVHIGLVMSHSSYLTV